LISTARWSLSEQEFETSTLISSENKSAAGKIISMSYRDIDEQRLLNSSILITWLSLE